MPDACWDGSPSGHLTPLGDPIALLLHPGALVGRTSRLGTTDRARSTTPG
ncbi:hypothetical protein FM103_19450 [Corynebacterium xerosis]|nr:hypothetical protein FM103_19450 [Corynebacterium xerosis]